MATSSISEEEKWKRCSSDSGQEKEEEEEEEEALSLCDLPVNLINEEDQSSRGEGQEINVDNEDQEFDFVPLLGGNSSDSSKSEMCAADDIFFQGQMLPLRHSVSSENKFKHDSLNPSRCVSRSQSMDHGRFTSFSSRSSSTRSDHYSSSSTSSSNHIGRSSSCPGISNPTRRTYNPFHAHPSPKPQIRLSSSSSLGNAASRKSCSSSSSSSVWDFFRFGLVRTPEIELQDLKFRASVSRNSSSNSSTQSNSSIGKKKVEKQRKQGFFDKRRALISGCSCSVGTAVKPVLLNHNTIINKSSCTTTDTAATGKGKNEKSEKRDDYHHYHRNHHYQSMDEKLKEMKKNKKTVEKQKQKQKQKQEDKEEEGKRKKGSSSGKQAMSRHRTFEWINELSHASFLDQ